MTKLDLKVLENDLAKKNTIKWNNSKAQIEKWNGVKV